MGTLIFCIKCFLFLKIIALCRIRKSETALKTQITQKYPLMHTMGAKNHVSGVCINEFCRIGWAPCTSKNIIWININLDPFWGQLVQNWPFFDPTQPHPPQNWINPVGLAQKLVWLWPYYHSAVSPLKKTNWINVILQMSEVIDLIW